MLQAYDDIIEIGALKVKDNKVISTFESLVYSEDMNDFIYDLTGITEEMVLEAAQPNLVLKNFLNFL